MALRPARFSRVSINENATAEAYTFPQTGPADLTAGSPLIRVPLYRGIAELPDAVTGKFAASGGVPSNLDLRFFPRYSTILMGRGNYTKTTLATGKYRHRWGMGEPLLANLQLDSLSPSALTHVLQEVLPGGFSLAGAATGGAAYSPTFTGSGKKSTNQIDVTPTLEPYRALSNLNGQVILGTDILGDVVSGFSLNYGTDLQTVDTYFSKYTRLVGAGDLTLTGELSVLYENEDFYNMALNETRPYFECVYGNKPTDQFPTEWVRFMCGAVRLGEGLANYGGKGVLANRQPFEGVPYDASDETGIPAEIMTGIGPWTIAATDVDLHFKINGGSTITKTLTAGAGKTAANIVSDIGSFTGGFARVWGGRAAIVTTGKGAARSVQIVDAGVNSAHDVLGMDLVARAGSDSPFVIEVVNPVSADY